MDSLKWVPVSPPRVEVPKLQDYTSVELWNTILDKNSVKVFQTQAVQRKELSSFSVSKSTEGRLVTGAKFSTDTMDTEECERRSDESSSEGSHVRPGRFGCLYSSEFSLAQPRQISTIHGGCGGGLAAGTPLTLAQAVHSSNSGGSSGDLAADPPPLPSYRKALTIRIARMKL